MKSDAAKEGGDQEMPQPQYLKALGIGMRARAPEWVAEGGELQFAVKEWLQLAARAGINWNFSRLRTVEAQTPTKAFHHGLHGFHG